MSAIIDSNIHTNRVSAIIDSNIDTVMSEIKLQMSVPLGFL